MGYASWGMGGFGGIGLILFWILIVLAIVWLVRNLELGRGPGRRDEASRYDERRAENRRDGGDDRALAILRERYARGEIDADEFETRKRDLLRRDDA